MVDGIAISPSVPGAGIAKNAESYGSLNNVKETAALYKTEDTKKTPGSGAEQESQITAALKKAAEEDSSSLNAESIQEFLKKAEEVINASLPQELPNTTLRIDQDDATGIFVYQGVDKSSGEVVRQWPADEILKFLAYYREQEGAEGIVVDVET
ncbi:flagellar protein FlaG [Emcibacter nanhaiensis]|uniref:Flagellar protein FlaG n=1 Tax=Emcibacter nanhaiensis TaxID=1505037 RepID=A0A501PQL1_9PROT|nr:flagellar protein FlaG [Emcibacter nanhaiensis]TPD62819.1 flagellar protein FlaG [Emcibacter nanhaiensis]